MIYPADKTGNTIIIAEIGLNHNGSVDIAKQLIDVAVTAGCDIVKFQKRTPALCLPKHLHDEMRDSPFGRMTYLAYRERIEFYEEQYHSIDRYCRGKNIVWTASPWDVESVHFLDRFDVPLFKIASATLTNLEVLQEVAKTSKPVVLSTGMSSLYQITRAEGVLTTYGCTDLTLMVCTSTYPCPIEELNLQRIVTLKGNFPEHRVGYSGHEVGLWTTLAAVALGAQIVERHITLDRTMPGSDHAASIEPHGLIKLVKEIRSYEKARGTGLIGPIPSELPIMKRLRPAI